MTNRYVILIAVLLPSTLLAMDPPPGHSLNETHSDRLSASFSIQAESDPGSRIPSEREMGLMRSAPSAYRHASSGTPGMPGERRQTSSEEGEEKGKGASETDPLIDPSAPGPAYGIETHLQLEDFNLLADSIPRVSLPTRLTFLEQSLQVTAGADDNIPTRIERLESEVGSNSREALPPIGAILDRAPILARINRLENIASDTGDFTFILPDIRNMEAHIGLSTEGEDIPTRLTTIAETLGIQSDVEAQRLNMVTQILLLKSILGISNNKSPDASIQEPDGEDGFSLRRYVPRNLSKWKSTLFLIFLLEVATKYILMFASGPFPGSPGNFRNPIVMMTTGPTITVLAAQYTAEAFSNRLLTRPQLKWLIGYAILFLGAVGTFYGLGQALEKFDSVNPKHSGFWDLAQSDFLFFNLYYSSMVSILVVYQLVAKYWEQVNKRHKKKD